jgi:hypothetical protein
MRFMNPHRPHLYRILGCTKRRILLAATAVLWLGIAGSLPGHAQVSPSNGIPPSNPLGAPGTRLGNLSGPAPADPNAAREERQMEAAQVADRFKHIQQDTQTLLQLATELQAAVDKTDRSQMSLDVIRKAEQIEKLAKSVKEKMRQQ